MFLDIHISGTSGSESESVIHHFNLLALLLFDSKSYGKILELYFRLYHLCANKEALVSEYGRWVNESWVWDLVWRRALFDREREATNELISAISSVTPIAGNKDGWIWKAASDGKYSTKLAYACIEEHKNRSALAPTVKDLLKMWGTATLQKARVAAWRVLRNRMPTCDNLKMRNIPLDEVDSMCSACFQHNESTNHLFLLCPKTEKVWDEIQRWLGLSTIRPQLVTTHFESFTNLGMGKKNEKFLTALWMCTVWQLWKRRNDCRFDGKAWETKKLFFEIKAIMWSWVKIFNLLDVEPSFAS
ncbi:uncharacterized protein LOC130990997 [Salvia miltiorrhiza]|uniref:uncharacterized protein LOC130990997 n=1 Tax=Salvia miltiorrhiza TaxID=226208 RepID=UPI0025AC54EB|nr:uncharacterized protein LOC130990997 [Salvia miltiorrhiza]